MTNEHISTVRTITDENGDIYMHVEDFEIGLMSQVYYELDNCGLARDEIDLIERFVECIQDSLDQIINGDAI